MEKIDILNHMTAGKSVFTLLSTKTEKRYTYKIKSDKTNDKRFFCQVMFGNENDSDKDYRFVGWFYTDTLQLKHSDKCKVTKDDSCFKMLDALLKLLSSTEPLPETCHFYPSTRCARCRRLLTTPESIQRGIGPECSKM